MATALDCAAALIYRKSPETTRRAARLSRRVSVDTARQIAYGPSVRRAPYRLVLPEGPLRRFRLPESLDDGDSAVRRSNEGGSLPAAAGLGWLGVCLCSWSLAAGVVDPAAILDQSWQLPANSGWGAGQVAFAGALGYEPAAVAPRAPTASRPAAAGTSRPVAATAPRAVVSNLPRVTFPDVQAHRGGFGAAPEPATSRASDEFAEDAALAMNAPGAALEHEAPSSVNLAPRAAASRAPSVETAQGSSLGQMVRDLVGDGASGLPRPPAASGADPFEADFAAASLPRLSSGKGVNAPVALRPREVQREGLPADPSGSERVSGQRGAVTWNGGCQRAFDASVQHIGDGAPARDATSADYTRVLARLDVAGCRPSGNQQIEVCVAISAGRAAGITVHTTPSTPALGECVVGKVRKLGFPASGGTDLVRTQYHVE